MSAAAKAMPVCLTRRSEDDRREALELGAPDYSAMLPDGTTKVFRDTLEAVQVIQAKSVLDCCPPPSYKGDSLRDLAHSVAFAASIETTEDDLTLDQRGRLLDAARELVALAIEVSA